MGIEISAWKVGKVRGGRGLGLASEALTSIRQQKTIFVILSVAKHLSFKAAEIRNEAVLRSE